MECIYQIALDFPRVDCRITANKGISSDSARFLPSIRAAFRNSHVILNDNEDIITPNTKNIVRDTPLVTRQADSGVALTGAKEYPIQPGRIATSKSVLNTKIDGSLFARSVEVSSED